MISSTITAVIPAYQSAGSQCIVWDNAGQSLARYCTVEQYMNHMARLIGNNNTACRKLFPHMRGTGLKLNDGSVFVALKLSPNAPSLGYIRYDAIAHLRLPDTAAVKGCILRLTNGQEIPLYWTLATVLKHIQRVQDGFSLAPLSIHLNCPFHTHIYDLQYK